MKRITMALVALLLLIPIITGCSQASTEPDEQALHYKGGAFSSSKFDNCIGTSTRNFDGPGDAHYIYPAGQRTFSFTGAKGSESAPLEVTTHDSQQLAVPGFVTFTLTGDCDSLRSFHERIGKKYGAYKDGGRDGQGWNEFLLDYIDVPLQAAMNEASLNFDWQTLYSDSAAQSEFEANVKADLPEQVATALGNKDYITINAVQIGKPLPAQALLDGLTAVEAAKLVKTAQDEKNKANVSKYQTFADCREAGLTEQACMTIYLSDSGKIPFWPIPAGANVNVTPPQ